MGFLNQMFRDMTQVKHGRIRTLRNMWAVIGSRWDKNRFEIGSTNHFTKDATGVLVRKQCTPRCPQPPIEDAWGVDGKWNVPMTECRKCQHHRKSAPGSRYPKCALLASTNPQLDAARQTVGMIGEAVEKAEEIVKGNIR